MRLLGVLALVAPAAVGILFLTNPGLPRRGSPTGPGRSSAAAAAVTIGVAMTSAIAWTPRPDPLRAPGQGRRADRRRRLHGRRPDDGRRHRGAASARAINAISASLADTHDRATIDRLTGVANRQALLAGSVRRGRAGVALRAPAVRRLRRHRPLQGGQRLVRPRGGRHRPARRRPDHRREPPGERPHRPLRRRGVHADPDRDRRRGRARRSARSCASSSSGCVSRVEGNAALSVTISIGIVGGVRPAAPDGEPRPRRRCRDVLGQVARAQPDLHLRGARRGRSRPARPDLRRRAGPGRSRSAGGRATRPRTC